MATILRYYAFQSPSQLAREIRELNAQLKGIPEQIANLEGQIAVLRAKYAKARETADWCQGLLRDDDKLIQALEAYVAAHKPSGRGLHAAKAQQGEFERLVQSKAAPLSPRRGRKRNLDAFRSALRMLIQQDDVPVSDPADAKGQQQSDPSTDAAETPGDGRSSGQNGAANPRKSARTAPVQPQPHPAASSPKDVTCPETGAAPAEQFSAGKERREKPHPNPAGVSAEASAPAARSGQTGAAPSPLLFPEEALPKQKRPDKA